MSTAGDVDGFTAEIDSALGAASFLEDPYPLFRRLRERGPIHWSPSWGMWLVTRHADVESIQRDPMGFSNAGRVDARLRSFTVQESSELSVFRSHFRSGVIDSDPPAHTRLRSFVVRAFTPRVVGAFLPRVTALATELLRPHLDRGEIEVVRDFAYPLPATIIAELLGLPAEDRDQFKSWANLITRFYGSHGADRLMAARAAQEAINEARDWISALAEVRRREPGDDVLSTLVKADIEGTITSDELLAICVTLLVAGHETLTALISVGIVSLLRDPEELSRLIGQPALWKSGVEELIRYVSPEQKTTRVATSDIEFGGRRIRAGDVVMLLLGAANRDPEVFPAPDRLIVDRSPNPHLGFGMGIHFCAGAGLARLEASVALQALATLPHVHLVEESLSWQADTNTRALESLVLKFDPMPPTTIG